MLRSTWRGLETWHGRGISDGVGAPALDPTDVEGAGDVVWVGTPGHTGAPAIDPTDERDGRRGDGHRPPSYRAHPRLYQSGSCQGPKPTGNCSGDPVNKLFDVITRRTTLKLSEAFLSGTAPAAAIW
jgi:hypothetical protein